MKRRLIVAVLVLAFAFGVCPSAALAVQGSGLKGADMHAQASLPVDLGDEGYMLYVDGAPGWTKCYVDGPTGVVTPSVELYYEGPNGSVKVPTDNFKLLFQQQIWTDDSDEPIIVGVAPPFGVGEDGVGDSIRVVAVPNDGSSMIGQTMPAYIDVFDKRTFAYIGMEVGLEGFEPTNEQDAHFHMWHNYYQVPKGSAIVPYVIAGQTPANEGEVLGHSSYTIEYYDWAIDPNWERKAEAKLDGAPVAVGQYYCEIAGVDPYYGSTRIDFDIVESDDPHPVATEEMYRLYNPNSGEHFYTADVAERDMLAGIGWADEGIGWIAPAGGAGEPVYRLYNANGGEHHYTMSAGERDFLVGVGWTDEGVGWFSDPTRTVGLYREYNPNAFANNHNYTTSKDEHDWLIGLGWRDETEGGKAFAWYAVAEAPN